MSDFTRILGAVARGDQASADELLPLVYQELRKLAAHKMAGLAKLRYFVGMTFEEAAEVLWTGPTCAPVPAFAERETQ